jgi:hypothetical protein
MKKNQHNFRVKCSTRLLSAPTELEYVYKQIQSCIIQVHRTSNIQVPQYQMHNHIFRGVQGSMIMHIWRIQFRLI